MTINLTDPQAPVTDEELDHLIWGLERYGLYPRQLAALKELRELKKAKDGEQQNQQQNIPENIPTLRDGLAAIRNSGVAIDVEKILAERDALNAPATPDGWKEEAEKLAEAYGAAFVIFRHGEEPVCADPTKFWFGFDPAAPKEAE